MSIYCKNCGNIIPDGSAFCSNCGAKIEPEQPANPPVGDSVNRPGNVPPVYTHPTQAPPSGDPGNRPDGAYIVRGPVNQPPAYGGTNVQPQYRPPQQQAGYMPAKPKMSILGLVAIITAAAVLVICVASYFLFFARSQPQEQAAVNPTYMTDDEPGAAFADATEEPTAAPTVEATMESTAPPTVEPTVEPTAEPTVEPTVEPTTNPVETVSGQTITVSMDYDSGEGVYSGEVKDGVPNGQGSFEMVDSDNDKEWSYDGEWENGIIAGEGTMISGDFVYTGTFDDGWLNGSSTIIDDGIVRYKGMCRDGMLNGKGTMYTKSGTLIFEGEFENNMLVESAAERKARGEAFMPECDDMDEDLYDGCVAEDNTFDYPVAVWGFPMGMSEQDARGSIVIGHMGDDNYPVYLEYRYGVDEPKMTSDDWINAWGVVIGIYEYVDSDGIDVTCPRVEVIYWNNEQEGL